MNKKDTIREFIRSRKEGYQFSIKWLAERAANWEVAGITEKDIDNVCRELLEANFGGERVLDRNKNGHVWVYTVNADIATRWFAEHPPRPEVRIHLPLVLPSNQSVPAPVRKAAKRRPPFVIAIDAEIAQLEAKNERLVSGIQNVNWRAKTESTPRHLQNVVVELTDALLTAEERE